MPRQSFELSMLLGVANLLADNPSAEVKLWSELDAHGEPNDGAQPTGSVPILIDRYDGDGDYVVLTDYTVDDDPSLSEQTIGIQATIRSGSLDVVKAISSDIYALLHGRWGGMLGTIRLVNASRSSGTNVGQDSNNRQGRIENYYARVHRPSPNRQ